MSHLLLFILSIGFRCSADGTLFYNVTVHSSYSATQRKFKMRTAVTRTKLTSHKTYHMHVHLFRGGHTHSFSTTQWTFSHRICHKTYMVLLQNINASIGAFCDLRKSFHRSIFVMRSGWKTFIWFFNALFSSSNEFLILDNSWLGISGPPPPPI